jgi:putative ABC transport system ATP-binding protein
MSPTLLLEGHGLTKTYRSGPATVRALDGVSIVVPAGSLTLLTGPSGSGKTTLLAVLGTLERPTAGTVLFTGRDLTWCSEAELSRVRRRVGFVFQDFALIPGLPVWENVTYPLIPRGVGSRDRRRRADELLGRLGLGDLGSVRPPELSGGEQQRVALARALSGRPEILFADEPTSNLDPTTTNVVTDVLTELLRAGTTVLVASHDPGLARLASRVYTLEAGRLTCV